MPHGTPSARCSARCAARATSCRDGEREVGDLAQCQRDRDLERGAGRQAGAHWHGRRDREVGPDGRPTQLVQDARHGRDGTSPGGLDRGRILCTARVDVDEARILGRTRNDASVTARCERNRHLAIDRQSHDDSFVVVDLSTDQVDARGRADAHVHRSAGIAARSPRAASSGTTGFASVPLPSSPEAT